jgi:hypothetical protein
MGRRLARISFFGACWLAALSLVHCGGEDSDLTQGECDALSGQAYPPS